MGLFRHPFECFSSNRVQKGIHVGGGDIRELPDNVIIDILSRLPDDVIIDILSRLPAECVLNHRRVCKRWLALTSTPYFARLHLKRSTPVLLVQQRRNDINRRFDLFQLDDEYTQKTRKKTMMRNKKICDDFIGLVGEHKLELRATCDGLLVFQGRASSAPIFLVCNIVTREQVFINGPVSDSSCDSSVHAMFLHPVSREYMMLGQTPSQATSPEYYSRFDFHLYNFTSKSWRQISSFHDIPEYAPPPVLYNNKIHWVTASGFYRRKFFIPPCDNAIFTFDTITEEFRVMPHPGDTCYFPKHHMFLLLYEDVAEGTLCLCWPKQTPPIGIEIWALKDYDKWIWEKKKFIETIETRGFLIPKVMCEQDLVYRDNTVHLYKVHLHDKNIVEYTRKVVGDKMARPIVEILPWTKSFVSLNGGIQRELALID